MGRPPKPEDEKRTERFSLYLTPEEAETVRKGADSTGQSVNQWLTGLVLVGGIVLIAALLAEGGKKHEE